MSNQEYVEQEINLGKYIDVIVKRKKYILIIFFVSIITATIVSLATPNVYRATASLMIESYKMMESSKRIEPSKTPSTIMSPYISLSLPTHKELVKSNIIVERIFERFKAANRQYRILSGEDLSRKLNIKEVKDTSIMHLRAEDTDPRKAKELADIWVEEYIKYSQELIFGEIKGAGDFITSQFEISKQNLLQAEQWVNDFNDKYKLDLMRAELDLKKEGLNVDKGELLRSEINLKSKENNLAELKKAIVKQDRFIIISKAMSDDALWYKESRKKGAGGLDKRKLKSEEINPIYLDLETRIVNSEIELNTLKQKIDYLRKAQDQSLKEIDKLTKTINELEFELTQLNRQVAIYKGSYDNFSIQIENARITKAAQLGEVKLISRAFIPRYPIKPNRIQNVAISGLVSLMFGVFLVSFLEYYKNSKSVISDI